MPNPKPYKRAGSSHYWLRTTVGGREVRESTGTSNHREAEQYIKRRLEELRDQGSQSLSYKEAVARFFEGTELKRKTVLQYQSSASRFARFFGQDLPLGKIDRPMLKSFVEIRKQEVKDASIKRDLAFLSSLFTDQQDRFEDAPEINPVVQFTQKKKLKDPKRQRWLTESEVQRLADACTQDMHRAVIWFAVLTGMRHQELCHLTYEGAGVESGVYLRFQEREVHVEESKTDNPRVIPLSDPAIRTLVGTPRHSRSAHVFWHSEGEPYHDFRNWFEAARRRAILDDVRFHDLRHTFATWWVRAGGDERHLQRILGHETPEMVQRYGHLASKDLHEVVRTVVGS